jgi:hypothetical protein
MKTASLTDFEKRIVKRLVTDGMTNQDAHHLINLGRTPSVNFGRLSGAKDWTTEAATSDEIERYRYEKSLFDLRTELSPFDHERLVRAREAMILAIQSFNTPSLCFKAELFCMLSNVAWTYLLHEHYARLDISPIDKDGNAFLISYMVKRPDFPLSKDIAKNLLAIKKLRDDVEHKTLKSFGKTFYPFFQANCLNFDESIRFLFGQKTGLGNDLSYALQLTKLSAEQISQIQKFDLNEEIEAINKGLELASGADGTEGLSYKFKVSYSFEKAAKGDSHIVFTQNNASGKAKKEILVQKVASDEQWPFLPGVVRSMVSKATGKPFTLHNHTQAWRLYDARPQGSSTTPEKCNQKFCTYHPAYGNYTYSQEWADHLISAVKDPSEFQKIKTHKF